MSLCFPVSKSCPCLLFTYILPKFHPFPTPYTHILPMSLPIHSSYPYPHSLPISFVSNTTYISTPCLPISTSHLPSPHIHKSLTIATLPISTFPTVSYLHSISFEHLTYIHLHFPSPYPQSNLPISIRIITCPYTISTCPYLRVCWVLIRKIWYAWYGDCGVVSNLTNSLCPNFTYITSYPYPKLCPSLPHVTTMSKFYLCHNSPRLLTHIQVTCPNFTYVATFPMSTLYPCPQVVLMACSWVAYCVRVLTIS